MTQKTAHTGTPNAEPDLADYSLWLKVNALQQAYVDAMDRGDVAGLLAVFTKDAIWDSSPGAARHGHDAIGEFFRGRLRLFAATSHHAGPPVVRGSLAANSLEATSYFQATHVHRDDTRYTIYGRYVDDLTKDGDNILIKRRLVIVHVAEGTKRVYNALPRHQVE